MLKTEQDSPIVTNEHYTEVALLIVLPHSYPPLPRFRSKIRLNINISFWPIWSQTTAFVIVNRVWSLSCHGCCQLLSSECDRRNLLLTVVVCCIATTPTSVVERQSQTGGGPASYCNLCALHTCRCCKFATHIADDSTVCFIIIIIIIKERFNVAFSK